MYNQKMKNIELLNKYNYVKFDAKEWASVVLGIRKSLNLSQTQLSKKLGVCRQSISRFEAKQRVPNQESINKILNFVNENNLNVENLIQIGNNYSSEYLGREKIVKLHLEKSIELAELIGIILGDGEIKKDGSIRIAFDPKKDKNFLSRRVFSLIHNLLGNKIGFESDGRIAFGNIAFVRFLKSIDLNPGSKFVHHWEIPRWCFDKPEYTSAVLRGLFDTDGYFGYCGSVEIMLGRFSDRSHGLVKSISFALRTLNIKHKVKQDKDTRYRIIISNHTDIFKFFNIVGTSNLRHITRFLLWRTHRYEAKIELEGLPHLIKKVNNSLNVDIENLDLPFMWNLDNQHFHSFITKDLSEVKGAEIRNLFKWSEITKDLISLVGNKKLALEFNITERSIRKWREGIRNPSNKFVLKLIKLLRDYNLNLDNYKRNDKMATQTVEALVEGGKATAAPPMGPAL